VAQRDKLRERERNEEDKSDNFALGNNRIVPEPTYNEGTTDHMINSVNLTDVLEDKIPYIYEKD